MDTALTDVAHWDDDWADVTLPQEIMRGRRANADAIAAVFDRYVPPSGTAIELGGAVGAWSAYVANKDLSVTVLDYSPRGVELTQRNLALLGVEATVVRADIFEAPIQQYDFVFSLGLIEHFTDVDVVIDAHVSRVRPGGTLLLGCPSFRGINRPLVRYLTPKRLDDHNLNTMDVKTWTRFEEKFDLERVFRGYVGGFEPLAHSRTEDGRLDRRIVARGMWLLGGALNLRPIRPLRPNGAWASSYCMGVYRTHR